MKVTVLAMRDPIAQRYAFARYVLGEDRMSAAAIAGSFQAVGLMDAEEYDIVAAGWPSPDRTTEETGT